MTFRRRTTCVPRIKMGLSQKHMKNSLVIWMLLLSIGMPPMLMAQQKAMDSKPGLVLSPVVLEDGGWTGTSLLDRKKKRKKKWLKPKHNTFAVGLVGGDPLGLGARAIFRIGQFGASADFAYNRLRDDDGDKLGALGMKTDFRLYTKDPLMKIVRAYTFVGLTSHRAMFNETKHQSVYLIDGGFGAGVKLFRLEIGAEAGLLIPARQVENYKPGLGAFVNASVMLWLF